MKTFNRTHWILIGILVFTFIASIFIHIKNNSLKSTEQSLIITKFDNIDFKEYNCAPGNDLKISVNFDLVIKRPDTTISSYFYRVFQVMPDWQGNIYVSQLGDEASLKKYDKNGNFLTTIAKKGQGPGEISREFIFAVDSLSIFIADKIKSTIEQISVNGDFINSINLQLNGMEIWDFCTHQNQVFLGHKNSNNFTNSIHVFSKTLQKEHSISMGRFFKKPRTPGEHYFVQKSLEGKLFVYNNYIYYMSMGQYMIYRYQKNGTLDLIIRRQCDMVPDAVLQIQTLPGGMQGRSFVYNFYPSMIAKVQDYIIIVLYFKEKIRNTGTIIDIYSTKGEYVGSHIMEERILVTSIKNNKMYGALYDDLNELQIVRLNLTIN